MAMAHRRLEGFLRGLHGSHAAELAAQPAAATADVAMDARPATLLSDRAV